MATAITHVVVGLAAGRIFFGGRMPKRFWLLAAGCSALPDLDVGLHFYGVEYGDLWGHRGMMHSLLFAAVLGFVVASTAFHRLVPPLSRRWWALSAFFGCVTASHGLIDGFTDGGLGIAYFAPFDTARYFMPWRPLAVPDMGVKYLFTHDTAMVLLSEMTWVWVPALGALALVEGVRVLRGGDADVGRPQCSAPKDLTEPRRPDESRGP